MSKQPDTIAIKIKLESCPICGAKLPDLGCRSQGNLVCTSCRSCGAVAQVVFVPRTVVAFPERSVIAKRFGLPIYPQPSKEPSRV